MPRAPLKACAEVGCSAKVARGYCEDHQRKTVPRNQVRKNPWRFMYNRRWEKARRLYLIEHPTCVECAKHNRITPATEVDHIVPHKGDPVIFWNTDNWQALCKPCHSRKTASDDGGFRNHSNRSRPP